MKLVILLVFLGGCWAAPADCGCSYDHGNGQPGCKTAEELGRLWRNNWDPTAYWKCEAAGQPAKLVRCSGQAFSDAEQKCVDWSCWVWTPPCDPPSKP
ncbi:unnamed protein product [Hermetia illucens]|uniref:Uncharacterized protein n=1 Tax=Hermetia illucens TaxID=343691 RepID=A0A7R8UKF0_HERIL|nr:uncharacterized protein LOC119648650 [Hermetia illucens]CAD7082264.1 unnamed protein product [Hermetia illucens]